MAHTMGKNCLDVLIIDVDLELLNVVTGPIDIMIIQSIPISKTLQADMLGWHFTKFGKYIVKSGYLT